MEVFILAQGSSRTHHQLRLAGSFSTGPGIIWKDGGRECPEKPTDAYRDVLLRKWSQLGEWTHLPPLEPWIPNTWLEDKLFHQNLPGFECVRLLSICYLSKQSKTICPVFPNWWIVTPAPLGYLQNDQKLNIKPSSQSYLGAGGLCDQPALQKKQEANSSTGNQWWKHSGYNLKNEGTETQKIYSLRIVCFHTISELLWALDKFFYCFN